MYQVDILGMMSTEYKEIPELKLGTEMTNYIRISVYPVDIQAMMLTGYTCPPCGCPIFHVYPVNILAMMSTGYTAGDVDLESIS